MLQGHRTPDRLYPFYDTRFIERSNLPLSGHLHVGEQGWQKNILFRDAPQLSVVDSYKRED